MATISRKTENTLDFNYLTNTYGAGGGAGGGATTGSGAVGAIAGTAAAIIAGVAGAKTKEELIQELAEKWLGRNGTPSTPGTQSQTAEKVQTSAQQIGAIEAWQQMQAQGIPRSIPRNASVTGTLPISIPKPDRLIGDNLNPKPKDIPMPHEQWTQTGGLHLPAPGSLTGEQALPLPAPGSLTGEKAGEVALPAPGSLTGEKAGEVALPAPGSITGTKTGEKAETITNVTPVETTKEAYQSPELKIENHEDWKHFYPNINNTQNYEEDNTKKEDYTQQINYNNLDDILARLKEEQLAQWEREDAIRKETQEREDTAYQRAVADMRKAGVNPNLVGVNPAESGGGITQATGMDYSMYTAVLNRELGLLEAQLNNAFKEDENSKDRVVDTFNNILQIASWLALITGGKAG